MKVLHCESGLGNQMLDYADYLAVKKANPEENCYLETIIFDIPEASEVISTWNGYELGSIFGINVPNIREIFTGRQWEEIMEDIKRSQFWLHEWNYPSAIGQAFARQGLELINHCESFYHKKRDDGFVKETLKNSFIWAYIRLYMRKYFQKAADVHNMKMLFERTDKDIFCGHTLAFMYNGNGIEKIEQEIRAAFRFPKIEGEENLKAKEIIESTNSIGIHIRRGDALHSTNRSIFKTGYYRKATKFIKQRIKAPIFFIFSDPYTHEWCRENLRILGLNTAMDQIHFIDWNNGGNSYVDMQLLSCCKHNIISSSSFGWWGAYLNRNPDKITCSPLEEINTTHHF